MESTWAALAVVAVVFTLFSGAAAIWDRLHQRRRQRLEASWRRASSPVAVALPERAAAPAAALAATHAAPAAVAAAPLAATEMQARRDALEQALDRMSRPAGAQAGDGGAANEWHDTQPMVAIGASPDFEPTRPFDVDH